MSTFEELLNIVFDDIYKINKDADIYDMKKDLKYVYENENEYRSQIISKKMRRLHHKIDQDTGKLVLIGKDTLSKPELPYMNFYEKIDDIFSELNNRYNWDTDVILGKEKIMEYYDKENAYRFPKSEKTEIYIDENGHLCLKKIIDD